MNRYRLRPIGSSVYGNASHSGSGAIMARYSRQPVRLLCNLPALAGGYTSQGEVRALERVVITRCVGVASFICQSSKGISRIPVPQGPSQ